MDLPDLHTITFTDNNVQADLVGHIIHELFHINFHLGQPFLDVKVLDGVDIIIERLLIKEFPDLYFHLGKHNALAVITGLGECDLFDNGFLIHINDHPQSIPLFLTVHADIREIARIIKTLEVVRNDRLAIFLAHAGLDLGQDRGDADGFVALDINGLDKLADRSVRDSRSIRPHGRSIGWFRRSSIQRRVDRSFIRLNGRRAFSRGKGRTR